MKLDLQTNVHRYEGGSYYYDQDAWLSWIGECCCCYWNWTNAVYKAFDQIVGVVVQLEDYSMNLSLKKLKLLLASTRVVLYPVVGAGPNNNSPLISKDEERKFSGTPKRNNNKTFPCTKEGRK